jgi:hypothetical protein
MSAALSFIDKRQFLTVIQPNFPLHECADPTPVSLLSLFILLLTLLLLRRPLLALLLLSLLLSLFILLLTLLVLVL